MREQGKENRNLISNFSSHPPKLSLPSSQEEKVLNKLSNNSSSIPHGTEATGQTSALKSGEMGEYRGKQLMGNRSSWRL